MTRWFKVAEGIFNSPKVVSAGPLGAPVFMALLDLNSLGSRDGQLVATPTVILARLSAFQLTLAKVRKGMAQCVAAGLIRCAGDTVTLLGWDDTWRPLVTGAERSQRYREQRKRDGAPSRGVTERDAERVTNASQPVTQSDASEKDIDSEKACMLSGSGSGSGDASMLFRSAPVPDPECSRNAPGAPDLSPTDDPKVLAFRARAAAIRERRAKEIHEPETTVGEPRSITPDDIGPIYGEAGQ